MRELRKALPGCKMCMMSPTALPAAGASDGSRWFPAERRPWTGRSASRRRAGRRFRYQCHSSGEVGIRVLVAPTDAR